MAKNYVTVWSGKPPEKCQLCNAPIVTEFIDGRTRMGPWAYMCQKCHDTKGCGLGMGCGQMYFKRTENGKTFWQKEGG